jgi:hypothetical protein
MILVRSALRGDPGTPLGYQTPLQFPTVGDGLSHLYHGAGGHIGATTAAFFTVAE